MEIVKEEFLKMQENPKKIFKKYGFTLYDYNVAIDCYNEMIQRKCCYTFNTKVKDFFEKFGYKAEIQGADYKIIQSTKKC